MQRLAYFQRLAPMPIGSLLAAFFEAQVAYALERACQPNLVVVAACERQPTLIILARLIKLAQGAGGVAQVYQCDTLATRVLGLFLKLARPLVIGQRLLKAAHPAHDSTDDAA